MILALLGTAGCRREVSLESPLVREAGASAVTNYDAIGVVVRLEPDGRTLVVRHEEITNYMGAMTMPFKVRQTNLLAAAQPGCRIAFRLAVTGGDGWIESLRVLETNPAPPQRPLMRRVRDVDPLKEGDLLPDYSLVNQSGLPVHLKDYQGQVIAFTFFFTSCPYPLFCPKMCSNFSEAAELLSHDARAPKSWHLFAISFDPETDSPPVLKSYARRYNYNPEQWSFLTGALIDITALGQQFGLDFWRESGSITHNLRTVVIDPWGRVFKITQSNEWTPAMLVEAMKQAADAPPK